METNNIVSDWAWGARAIAIEIGLPDSSAGSKAVYHLADKKELPIRRIGGKLVASRAALRAALLGEKDVTK